MKNLKTNLTSVAAMLKPLGGKLLVSVLIGLVRIACSLTFVWVCKTLIDVVTGISQEPLGRYIAFFVGIMALQILCSTFASYWESYMMVDTSNKLRHQTFSHVLGSTWNGKEAYRSGDAVNRLEEDVRVVTDLLCSRIPAVTVTFCQLVAASLFMLSMETRLLWLLLLFMVVAVLGSRMFVRKLSELTREIRSKDAGIQQYMQENLLNRILVLTLTGTSRVVEKLGLMQKDLKDRTVTRMNYNAVARSFMHVGFTAGYVSAFLWGVLGIKDGTVTYGMMTAFLQLVGQVQRPVADLAHHVPAFIHAFVSVERIKELQDLESETDGAVVTLPGAPSISLADVTFAYPEQQKPVLDGFSCSFPAGTLTLIAGPTGAGKSTLVRIIMGLLRPSAGTVEVGGHPAGVSTRSNFMYVPQGNSLLSGTIRENLQLADPHASEEEMLRVLSLSQADFVKDLPDGLDTRCGEVGSGLSEGQSQRIAIARALLHQGGVLILDEATSALDSDTELALLKTLFENYHGVKTILFISHREAVTRFADSVLMLQ